jgi:hypothetical protein
MCAEHVARRVSVLLEAAEVASLVVGGGCGPPLVDEPLVKRGASGRGAGGAVLHNSPNLSFAGFIDGALLAVGAAVALQRLG